MKAKQTQRSHVLRGMVGAAAFVVVVAGLRTARPVVVPLLVATFVALACVPAVNWLRRWLPRGLAVAIVVIGVVLGVVGVATFLGSSLTEFAAVLPTYQARLLLYVEGYLNSLTARGLQLPERDLFAGAVDPGAALGFVALLLNALREVLTSSLLILLTVVFILLEVSTFRTKLRRAFDVPEATFPAINLFVAGMKQYFFIKTLTSLITGTLIAVWLSAVGVDFPLLWGFFAFLLNYIPNIGSFVAAIPATLLALVQISAGAALTAALGFLIVNVSVGNLLEPRWMGQGVGLSPLVVFLSLLVWGWILGPVGLLLSVPLSVTLKIALESSEETLWIAVLMGPENPSPGTPLTS